MMDKVDVVASARKENISPLQQKLDVGLALRQGRERLGMSVHDIAERIKFAPRQVEALEANDFTHLPEPAFLRGFVRSYARVLQLDDVALVASLPTDPAKQDVVRTQTVNVPFPTLQSLRRINVMWLAGALGVTIVLGWFVLMHKAETTSQSAKVIVESVTLPAAEMAASAPAEAGGQAMEAEPDKVAESGMKHEEKQLEAARIAEPERTSEPAKVADTIKKHEEKKPEPARTAEPKNASKPVKAVEPEKKPEPARIKLPEVKTLPQVEAASAPAAAVKTEIPLEMLKRRPLHFVFTESAWVEVIDSRGAVLLSRNNARGTEKWIGGPRHEPYDISISHPEHVKLYYRGQQVDLSAYAGMDVAHLKVE
jgi:cytoskeleton protein RodZ